MSDTFEVQGVPVAVSNADEVRGAPDPDQPVFEADLTIDGHTQKFQAKSEEQLEEDVTQFLKSRGIGAEEDEGAEIPALPTQSVDLIASDVHDIRNDEDEQVTPEGDDS